MIFKGSLLNKAGVVLFAVIAMTAGFWLATTLKSADSENIPNIQGVVLKPARQIAVPELTKHDGTAFTNAGLNGKWTLMFFGYTHCPDICPTTMNVLAEAKKNSAGDFPQVVFVTLDPERDTVDMLGGYVHYFDPEFTGVTGEEKM